MRALALACALTLPGCSGGCVPGPDDAECLDARAAPADGQEVARVGVLVGDELVPLDEAGPLPLERGAQGGQHFTVAIDRFALADTRWSHQLVLTDPGGRLLGETTAFAEGCAPGWVRSAQVAFPVRSSTVTGGTVRMTSTALDADYAPIRSLPEVVTRVELAGF